MPKSVVLVIVVILSALLEISILPILGIAGASASLVAIGVASLFLLGTLESAAVVAILGGTLLDLLFPSPFGRQTITLLLIWVVFFFVSRYRLVAPQAVVVSVTMALTGLLVGLPNFIASRDLLFLISSIFLHALLGTIVFPLFVLLFPRREAIRL